MTCMHSPSDIRAVLRQPVCPPSEPTMRPVEERRPLDRHPFSCRPAAAIVPAMEAVAAGALWRRLGRPWLVFAAYVERIIPLAVTIMLCVSLVWMAVAL